ncbi:unnamed protein product [Fusarium venenatum]|uniref:Uncharacterized protein n=1 Tax=Fusarium venenatum TaxID=56646 RepID=A0A2L2SR90_9HYPO|nr:uncharacterized protein FVRRES_12112 [Fusarium venenatum]CEI39421.1 unnamed protein product [Fusarium venenatum]
MTTVKNQARCDEAQSLLDSKIETAGTVSFKTCCGPLRRE